MTSTRKVVGRAASGPKAAYPATDRKMKSTAKVEKAATNILSGCFSENGWPLGRVTGDHDSIVGL